jgi:Leucine-rich repeat (LRR) protein
MIGSELTPAKIIGESDHQILHFNDENELHALIESLDEETIANTKYLTLQWVGWNNWYEKNPIDFSNLKIFENLEELDLIADYEIQFGSPGSSPEHPIVMESLITLPIMEKVKRLKIARFSLYYYENVGRYPEDLVREFLDTINQFPLLTSLQLSDGFFFNIFDGIISEGVSSHLGDLKLEELDISENGLNRKYATIYRDDFLKDLSKLKDLKKLNLAGGARLSDETLQELSRVPQLESLKISNTFVNSTNATLGPLLNLKELDYIPFKTFLNWPHSFEWHLNLSSPFVSSYPQLEVLTIHINEKTNPTIMDLNQHPNLKKLIADESVINDYTIEQMNHMQIPHLKELYMRETKVKGVKWDSFAPSLTTLWLTQTITSPKDMTAIGNLTELEDLNLAYTKISGSSIKKLKNLQSLRRLNLNGNNLNFADFSSMSSLANLEVLYISDADLQMDDLETLKTLKQLKLLEIYGLRNYNITREHIQKLEMALPNTRVISNL